MCIESKNFDILISLHKEKKITTLKNIISFDLPTEE